jgi:hypothetical protein
MICGDGPMSRGDRQAQVCHLSERKLSLAKGHTVSLFSQKIKQEGGVLLTILN